MKIGKTRAMARAAGWPFPVRVSPDGPRELIRTWLRLHGRLRWALRNEADVAGNKSASAKLARLKREARIRGIEVTLTRDEYAALILSGSCRYCGAALPTTGHAIDRINCNRGYTAENVVAACDTCNRVKADIFTFEQMLEIGELLRTWRAQGRWNDPPRRRPGGRPPIGDLRQEIEAWNRQNAGADQRVLSALVDPDAGGQA